MECLYCNKKCKNKNSLIQHQVRCKLNENKIKIISNYILYNKKIKNGDIIKNNTNQFTKAKNSNAPIPIVTEKTRKKLSNINKNKKWSEERKEEHSKIMIETAIKYPLSYSAQNVCGRTKLYEAIDSYGNKTKLNGKWEQLVVQFLIENNIKWTNIIHEKFIYFWNTKNRIYYPDFYLPDLNKYIEVKGYERERDLYKWQNEQIKNRLFIIKYKEIKEIKNKSLNAFNFFKINIT